MPSSLRQKRDEERKQRSRRTLLLAARRTFVAKGYHHTLISDIVAEAGFGQGTFYRHFESKRAAFEAILDQFIADLLGQFDGMSSQLPRNAAEYHKASLDGVTKMAVVIQKNRDVARLILREAKTIDPDFEAKVSGFFDRFQDLAQYYLDHAVASGFARPCDTAVVSQALIGMGLRMIEKHLDEPVGADSVEAAIREVVDFAFLGFGPETDTRDTEGGGK